MKRISALVIVSLLSIASLSAYTVALAPGEVKLDVVEDVGYDVFNFVLNAPTCKSRMSAGHQYSILATPTVKAWTAAQKADVSVPYVVKEGDQEALRSMKAAVEALKDSPSADKAKELITTIETAIGGLSFKMKTDEDRNDALVNAYWFALCYSDDPKIRKLLEGKIDALCRKKRPYPYRADMVLPTFLALPAYGSCDESKVENMMRLLNECKCGRRPDGFKDKAAAIRLVISMERSVRVLMEEESMPAVKKALVNIDRNMRELSKPGPIAVDPNCGAAERVSKASNWALPKNYMELKVAILESALETAQSDAKRNFLQSEIRSTEKKLKKHLQTEPKSR